MGLYTVKKYNFKSYDCDEVAWFDIAFANKEFFQNTQGQINKALQVRKWRDWERLDLRDNSAATFENRERTKARLIKTDPCLFAGDQGKAIARSKICKPSYVLEATIPRDDIKSDRRDHDFRAVVVFWVFQKESSGLTGPTALTFYNNYLDKEAQFSHFVHDGSSTSKDNPYAVGLKGKGFILATSFLAQECQQFKDDCQHSAQEEGRTINDVCKTILGMTHKPIGVGFNVGSRFCKGAYNKARPKMLQMKKEDLRALSLEEFQAENPHGKTKDVESDVGSDVESDVDSDDEKESDQWSQRRPRNAMFYMDKLSKTYKKRQELHIAEKPSKKANQPLPADPSEERSLVQEDDVCIHIIGLPSSLTPEDAFSGVFGIFEEKKVWKIPGTHFEVFEGRDRFYHRDQLVPVKGPLQDLGINYHGELRLSSDRMEIIQHGPEYSVYQAKLTEALDRAISTFPDLAIRIMKDMLESDRLQSRLKPSSKNNAAEYKLSFEGACGKQPQEVYPFARRSMEADLIHELGFHPWPLDDWQMQVLEDAGAYTSIKEYAQNCLAEAREVLETDLPGLEQLNRCVRLLIPDLKDDVSVRQYYHSTPRALHRDGRILLPHPKPCRKCVEPRCSCWVGPAIVRIMNEYNNEIELDDIFWVYDQDKRRLAEQERVDAQTQNPTKVVKEENSDLETSMDVGGTASRYNVTVESGSEDDDVGNDGFTVPGTLPDSGFGSRTKNVLSSKIGNGSHKPATALRFGTKTRTTARLETPPVLQNTSSSASSTREVFVMRSKLGSTAINLDASPRGRANNASKTSTMSDESEKLTGALEKLRFSVNSSIESANSGDFAAVPERLAEGLADQANAMQLALRAQRGMPSRGGQQDDGFLDSTPSQKRKRTR